MNTTHAADLLDKWLLHRLPDAQYHWLKERLELVNNENSIRNLHISFGLIPRRLGKADLSLTALELSAANTVNSGWAPSGWTIDTAARVLLLCKVVQSTNHTFGNLFKSLCRTADLGESIALYQGIGLYPLSDELDQQIGDGLRTNMRAVFEAIAHNNLYPQTHFAELRWNHMVLKALFIDSTLHPILGLDERANVELARILCDYAHERWAANRVVTPELWRCVGPFASGEMLDDLRKVMDSKNATERKAGALALSSCRDPIAAKILSKHPSDVLAITSGALTWNSISSELN
jgi:hypothetical protein